MTHVRIFPRFAATIAVILGMALIGGGVTAGLGPVEPPPLEAGDTLVLQPNADVFPAFGVPSSEGEIEVAVTGLWRFAHTGEDLPAAALLKGVEFPRIGTRSLVTVKPTPTEIRVTEDGRAVLHYDRLRAGRTISMAVDTDPIVDAYLVAPSVARASLSGDLEAMLMYRPALGSPWAAASPALAGGAALLLIGLVPLGLDSRRRRNTRARLLQREIARRVADLRTRLRDGDEASDYLTRVLAASGRAAEALAADLDRHRDVAGDDHPALAGLQRIADVVRELDDQVRARQVRASGRDVDAALEVADGALAELTVAAGSVASAADELERLEDLHRPRPRAAERSP